MCPGFYWSPHPSQQNMFKFLRTDHCIWSCDQMKRDVAKLFFLKSQPPPSFTCPTIQSANRCQCQCISTGTTCASGPLLCTACPSSLSRRNCEEIKLELETLLKQIYKFQVDRLIVRSEEHTSELQSLV